MKIFQVTREAKIGYWLAFLFLVFFASMLLNIFGLFEDIFKIHLSASEYAILIFWVLLFGLGIWVGYRNVLAAHTTNLIFEHDKLILKSRNHFKFLLLVEIKPFEVSYDQIKSVRFAGRASNIEIESMDGNFFQIVPGIFSKNYGEDVLDELLAHIALDAFDADLNLKDVMRKVTKLNNVTKIISVCVLLICILYGFSNITEVSRSWLSDAWQVKLSHQAFESMWIYSADSQNDLWTVFWRSKEYRIYHFSEGVNGIWRLSKELVSNKYPVFVSGDKSGRPIVWFEDSVYHYKEEGWEKIVYENNLLLDDGEGYVIDEEGWIIKKQIDQNSILRINALTGIWSVVPLPEDVIERGFEPILIRRSMTGDLLILMQSEFESRVYILSDENWRDQTYSILLPSQESRIKDFFLDEEKTLWVLFEMNNEYFVEKISQINERKVTQMPNSTGENLYGYAQISVDAFERIWVSDYLHTIKVFSPVWHGMAVEVIAYTDENSNYQSQDFVMLSDGTLWSLGQRISVLNTSSEVLPKPIPEWFSSINWSRVLMYTTLANVFYTLTTVFLYKRFLRKKKKTV